MNVEGLTRENVASHLQKYRLYLKRLSTQGAACAHAPMFSDAGDDGGADGGDDAGPPGAAPPAGSE
jgi:hypothetical protein